MKLCWNWRCTLALAALALPALALVTGCGKNEARFVRYSTFAHKIEKEQGVDKGFTHSQKQNVDELLAALFGTPDDPQLPALEGADITKVIDLNKLKMAAGRVLTTQEGRPQGLYREHCAHCHGITGDGYGPTAEFLNPYPRDYRAGIFKFKSTPIGRRPTHDDLKKIVLDGIPGTAMPSFALFSDQEVESLVHYVKYLAIRGEAERQLYYDLSQVDEGQRLVDSADPQDKDAVAKQKEQFDAVKGSLETIVGRWLEPAEYIASEAALVPSRDLTMQALREELQKNGASEKELTDEYLLTESRNRGRKLFYGTAANCFSCHGPSALGDGQLTDYDRWTEELIGKTPTQELINEYTALQMPHPRNVRPRNLRQGVYRGGMRPLDLFWRIRNGIEWMPMPANDKLTNDEVWHLVNYVQSLPYESISNPLEAEPEYLRERN